ncbi:hypothetical protein M427DRAFT_102476 [Gonapodya prolifera JEL478]|uniref:DNA primase large subunit C-terminal domain-containing protein n=1 Tax=Gonapodya prolifera (strain JEL478) TaxID=1344416 RepID=A0A139A3G5_GONPJ|nr:hypothetical protein M427DRAFT_102476 [Gonapodya prolifera JEL478]|eukprot:KXS11342.1 hypothetical protein M427DRAFT_102476 [Gonapodya prolifera JEL478]
MFKQKSAPRGASTAGSVKVAFSAPNESALPRLSFYSDYPSDEITALQFESWALDRLQVLKSIETALLRSKSDADVRQHVAQMMDKYIPLSRAERAGYKDLAYERRKDLVSHHILRLAFARSEDLRAWFLRQEVALFRYRWDACSADERTAFVDSLALDLHPVAADERRILEPSLRACDTRFLAKDASGGDPFAETQFYKIPWHKVLELVAARRVFVHRGTAYVPQDHILSLVVSEYKIHLTAALESTARALPRMEEDSRLAPVLVNLGTQHTNRLDFSASNAALAGQITHADIDKLAAAHFPPCMRSLHMALRRDAHLKHFGRMQYGLFLKGIGLSLEEALVFWRQAFRSKTDEEFQKSYAYNIRHNYGREGKRTDYTPYSCSKIITTNRPSTGDHHGCPFRDFAPDNLRALLSTFGVPEQGLPQVLQLAKEGHPEVACTRVFEITRGLGGEGGAQGRNMHGTTGLVETVGHPNQFFEMSYELAVSRAGGAAGVKKEEGAEDEVGTPAASSASAGAGSGGRLTSSSRWSRGSGGGGGRPRPSQTEPKKEAEVKREEAGDFEFDEMDEGEAARVLDTMDVE